MMQFRRFNDHGIETFRKHIEELRIDPKASFPRNILSDEALTEVLRPNISASEEVFENRMEFAKWLSNASLDSQAEPPRSDVGFWTWLTAALFDQVCPVDGNGKRKVGAEARYIPDLTKWTRRYRHLLANPFNVYQLHRDNPDRAAVALINPLHTPGELTEQFTGRLELVSCPGTMSLASALFIDPITGQRRKGASGKAARRLGKIMNQYTRTWDIPIVDSVEFAQLLPVEFNRFKPVVTDDIK